MNSHTTSSGPGHRSGADQAVGGSVDWSLRCGAKARLDVTYHRSALVVRLVGHFDASVVGELRVGLGEAIHHRPGLIELDGGGIEFCGAGALGVIADALAEADRTGIAYAGSGFAPEQLRLLRRGSPGLDHDRLAQPVAKLALDHEAAANGDGPAVNELEAELAQLRRAVADRSTMEQAKGVLMADRRCSPEEAFSLLVEVAQRTNRKLSDIAADLVERAASSDGEHRPG